MSYHVPILRLAREGGHALVVSRTGGGDILLEVVNDRGRASRSWFMRLRKPEVARVLAAIAEADTKTTA